MAWVLFRSAKDREDAELPYPEEECVVLDESDLCKECVVVEDLLDALVEDLLDAPFEDLFEDALEEMEGITVRVRSMLESWAIPIGSMFNLSTLALCPRTRTHSAFTTTKHCLCSSCKQRPIVQRDEGFH